MLYICSKDQNNIIYKDKILSWNTIQELHKIDSQNQLRMLPKISLRHVHLNSFAKMSVSLAANVSITI